MRPIQIQMINVQVVLFSNIRWVTLDAKHYFSIKNVPYALLNGNRGPNLSP